MRTMRRALVTGATGYIGGHLCRHLRAADYSVHALVRPASDVSRLNALAPGVLVHRSDADAASVAQVVALAAPHVVFHLASLAKVEHDPAEVDAMVEANLAFGVRLLEAAAETGAAVVNTGSHSEFDVNGGYDPESLYSATKAAFRTLLDYYRDKRGLRALTLVLFDVYGPDDWRNKFLQQLAARAGGDESLDATAGEQELDFIHVTDVARAYLRAADLLLAREGTVQVLYTVETGRRMTLRRVAELLEKVKGQAIPVAWGALPYRAGQRFSLWRGTVLPGWRAEVNLEDGLRDCFGR